MTKILTVLTLSFLLCLNFIHAQELIENGTFDDSTGIWLLEEYGGGDFTWNIIDGVGRIIINVQGDNFWDLQLKQKIEVEASWEYDISFDIAASDSAAVRVWIQTDHDDYVILDETTVTATKEWQTISYTSTEIEIDDADCKLTFVVGDVSVGDTVFFDNVSLSYTGTLDIEDYSNYQPFDFSLLQNYPNPFNPATTIAYSVKEKSMVNLEIYNTLGEKVQTLVNEVKTPGNYEIVWNASKFTSGIYFYRYKVNNNILTRKMILAR